MASTRSAEMERRTLEIVNAGDHAVLRISRQMVPLLIEVRNTPEKNRKNKQKKLRDRSRKGREEA